MESKPRPKIQELTIDEQIRAQEEVIATMDREIAELEEELKLVKKREREKKSQDKTSNNVSRRTFIRSGAMALAGVLLSPSSSKEEVLKHRKDDIRLEKGTIFERVEQQINACRQIIEEGKYNEVLNNTYLASALYYSEEAIKRMSEKVNLGAAEQIITTLYPLITREFRKKYLEMLSELAENAKLETKESKPLDRIDSGHTVEDNHQDAVDLFIKEGAPVYSVSSGIVVLSENGWTTEELSTSSMRGGNVVIIYNPQNKSFYRYAHMQETIPKAGNFIQSGAKIGVVGNTGINASKLGHGDHLHFEINIYDEESGVMRAMSARELRKKLELL